MLSWSIAAIGVFWLALSLRAFHCQRHIPVLKPTPPAGDDPPPVTVVIPARDEARAIEASVRSLLGQVGVRLQLIVVNDGSTDGTGAILDRIAAEDDRLVVIHDPAIADGWLGKTNALATGAKSATGEYVLFADADIRFAPHALCSAIDRMQRDRLDFLTLFPRFEWRTIFEHGVIPGFFLGVAAVDPKLHEDPSVRGKAIGVGAFLLVRRTAYEQVGGHTEIRASATDDLHLAQLLDDKGFRTGVGLAPDLLAVRMYLGNLEVLRAFEKNTLALLGPYWWLAPVGPIAFSLIFWLGPAGAIVGLIQGDVLLVLAGLGLYALQTLSLTLLRSWHRFSPLRLPLFSVFVVTLTRCTAVAMFRYARRGTVRWRGRDVVPSQKRVRG